MNNLQRFCAGNLAVLFLLTGCTHDIQATEITPKGNGYIDFYFADQTPQCGFPFGGVVKFVESPRGNSDDCKHLNKGGYFELFNVPSASNIWLVNGKPNAGQLPSTPKLCSNQPFEFTSFNWWKLTTIKQPTNTTHKVRIQDLNTLEIGDVVVPGVKLADKYDSHSNPAEPNAINCVIMEVSP